MALPDGLDRQAGVFIARAWAGGNDWNGVYHPAESWLLMWSPGVGQVVDHPPWPGPWTYQLVIVAGANYPVPTSDHRFLSTTIAGRSHIAAQVIKK